MLAALRDVSPKGGRDAGHWAGRDPPRHASAPRRVLADPRLPMRDGLMRAGRPAGEATMGKVGRFVTDPKAGAYCQIVLASGEKILVSHDKGGFKGGHLNIATLKWLGLASGETLFELDLDTTQGKAVIGRLTTGVPEGSARATPLGALLEYVKDCPSAGDVRARCPALGG